MSGHTPGPWELLPEEADRNYLRMRGTVLGLRYKIANVITPDWDGVPERELEETRANARLMCAAPIMFAAIEQFEAWWQAVGQVSFNGAPACVFALREAAAKARGEV